ncbi:MAG: TonB family protein [Bacteroidales bacterium]|nr:TonB family protein [Bacteroidales bacterium]
MKTKVISGACTAVIMLLVALVLISFGYDPPDPPIPEEGVEVNVGDSDFGRGDDPQPAVSSATPSFTPPPAQDNLATQMTEPTPTLNATPTPSPTVAPQPTEQVAEQPKTPEINTRAIFPGNRNKNNGSGSQGVSEGTGDQGKPNGTTTSTNYEGNGGGNGNYTLNGRTKVNLPLPTYKSNVQGRVIIQIWVNREGKVTRAEFQPKGSSTTNGSLVNKAKEAALKASFNPDPNAPEEQKGTITYLFVI